MRVVEFSHHLLRDSLRPGDMAIDATAGNGRDTLFLTKLTGPDGMVFAFDIQPQAIAVTRSLLEGAGVPPKSWQMIHAGHETMLEAIPERWHGHAGAVLFNLGYLPGSDKLVTTVADATLTAMHAALRMLRAGGVLVVVIYTGQPGGIDEARAVLDFAACLSTREYCAVEYRTINSRNHPPSVVAIQKIDGGSKT